jgi:hypothetical protein
MMSAGVHPICRRVFDAATLMAEFPPNFTHPNKRVVYDIACPPDSLSAGEIVFSRWATTGLPGHLPTRGVSPQFESRPDYFGYEPAAEGSGTVEWHLNFAHSHLFCAYAGALFAQDEQQVAEHPALGSLREALVRSDVAPLTVDAGRPTPALIMGVERRCRIATDRNAALGRPSGLYGNHFAAATRLAVATATQPIRPPTTSNILAMEAPPGGRGRYRVEDIRFILETAFTGFAATRVESRRAAPHRAAAHPPAVVVHTGFWGCGAYGGNRVLMALLQLLAAQLAGLDSLVFHAGDEAGTRAFRQGHETFQQLAASGGQPRPVSDVLRQVHAMDFAWGVSDGT